MYVLVVTEKYVKSKLYCTPFAVKIVFSKPDTEQNIIILILNEFALCTKIIYLICEKNILLINVTKMQPNFVTLFFLLLKVRGIEQNVTGQSTADFCGLGKIGAQKCKNNNCHFRQYCTAMTEENKSV